MLRMQCTDDVSSLHCSPTMPSSEVGVGRVRARVLRVEHPAAVHPTLPHRVHSILQVAHPA